MCYRINRFTTETEKIEIREEKITEGFKIRGEIKKWCNGYL